LKREGLEKEVNGYTSEVIVLYCCAGLVIETDFRTTDISYKCSKMIKPTNIDVTYNLMLTYN